MNTSEQELIDVFTGSAGARREREKLDDDGDDVEQTSTKTALTTIDPKALIGPAGKFVKTLAPHTEAPPESLLFQFLPCAGALLGRGPHIMAAGSRHGVNLFSVVVGPTASGRKGTARSLVERAVRLADPDFARKNIVSGLSSGEGLIHHIRDPIEKTVPIREKGRHTGEYETVIEDQGVSDKRVGIFEPEFSRVLKAASRDGSVLSEILRLAWDSHDLRVITKTCAETATDPHVSLVAHITAAELRETFAAVEFSNGAGNRYLWTLSQRSKLLPLDSSIDLPELLEPVAGELRLARDFWTENTQPSTFSADARDKWIAVYPALTADRDGLAGGLLARAEAQVLRVALLYSALDCSREIQSEHLSAALACWEYVEFSVREIFGNMIGKPAADQIFDALRADCKRGLSRTQISAIFGRHMMATVIESALGELEVSSKARCERTPTAGRPREVWYAIETAK